MVLSLPFPGEQGYRLDTTGDFYFYIWKANQGPAHNNPPLPLSLSLSSSSMTELNHTHTLTLTHKHSRHHTHLLISEHHVLIYVCVIFNMFQISKHEPMQMRWRGQYHKLNNSLCSVICCCRPHTAAAVLVFLTWVNRMKCCCTHACAFSMELEPGGG